MKSKAYYILQRETDKSYDIFEGKFYNSNWKPTLSDNKRYLEQLMKSDAAKFEGCVIITEEI